MPINDTTEAINTVVKNQIRKVLSAHSSHVQATFVLADTTDPELSTIKIFGKTATRVRKLNNVGAMTPGQPILCLQGGGMGIIIVGVILGNIA